MPRPHDGTEGFFTTIAMCWRSPGLLGRELLWRWSAGAVLLALAGWQAARMATAAAPAVEATGLTRFSLESAAADPEGAAAAFSSATAVLHPPVAHALTGLAPLALFLWAGAFALGRTALMRRYDPTLPARRFLLFACEGLRLLALAAVLWLWYAGLDAAAQYALSRSGPDLPLYAALVIGLSLGLFTLWSTLGWVLLAAPLVGILHRLPLTAALARSLRLRRARRRLLDVSLVSAVIKVALVVAAAALSATPLPFADVAPGTPMYLWYGFVTLLYCGASDFFKLARFLAFLESLRAEPVH